MPTATAGVSHEAEFLINSERIIRRRNLETVTLSRQIDFDHLRDEWNRCSSPNWDGDGAVEVRHECYRIARKLVEMLPTSVPSPMISCEPDGHINFEWFSAPRRTISISVSPEGMIYWASLIGTERMSAAFRFIGELPKAVRSSIARVVAG